VRRNKREPRPLLKGDRKRSPIGTNLCRRGPRPTPRSTLAVNPTIRRISLPSQWRVLGWHGEPLDQLFSWCAWATARDRPYYTTNRLVKHMYSRGDPLRSPWLLHSVHSPTLFLFAWGLIAFRAAGLFDRALLGAEDG